MSLKNITTTSSQPRTIQGSIISLRLAKDEKVGKNWRECFVSTIRDENAWWMADLGKEIVINSVGFLITKGSRKKTEKIQIELSSNSHLSMDMEQINRSCRLSQVCSWRWDMSTMRPYKQHFN